MVIRYPKYFLDFTEGDSSMSVYENEIVTIEDICRQYGVVGDPKNPKLRETLRNKIIAELSKREGYNGFLREHVNNIRAIADEVSHGPDSTAELERLNGERAAIEKQLGALDNQAASTTAEAQKKAQTKAALRTRLDAVKADIAKTGGDAAAAHRYNLAALGPPGVGKSTTCVNLAELMVACGLADKIVLAKELTSSIHGATDSQVRSYFEKAKGGILIFDEIGGAATNGYGGEALKAIVRNTGNTSEFYGKLSVFMNCYENEFNALRSSEPGLGRRFHSMSIPVPTLDQIVNAFYKLMEGEGYSIDQRDGTASAQAIKAAIRKELEKAYDAGEGFGYFGGVKSFFDAMKKGLRNRLMDTEEWGVYQRYMEANRGKAKEIARAKTLRQRVRLDDIPVVSVRSNGRGKQTVDYQSRPHGGEVVNLEAVEAELKGQSSAPVHPVKKKRLFGKRNDQQLAA